MCMTADELESRMSDEEFLEHLADCELLGRERDRDDLRTAALMVVVNQSQNGKLTEDQALDMLRIERVEAGKKPERGEMSDAALIAMFKRYPHTVA